MGKGWVGGSKRVLWGAVAAVLVVAAIVAAVVTTLPKNESEESLPRVEIQGGLTLSGTENRSYVGVHLVISGGDVILYDDAVLDVSKSKITVVQDYNKQYSIQVRGRASLLIADTTFDHQDKWFNFNYYDQAHVSIQRFQPRDANIPWHYADSTLSSVDIEFVNSPASITFKSAFNGQIKAEKCDHVYFEILVSSGTYDVTFPAGRTDYWRVPLAPGYVELIDSVIYEMDVTLEPGAYVTVRDGTSARFAFGWIMGGGWGMPSNGNPVTVTGVRNGHYDDKTWTGDNAQLRLINMDITNGWWPVINGDIDLTVVDCDVVDPWTYHTSSMTIRNSNIHYVTSTDTSVFTIEDSFIETQLVALGTSTIYCNNCDFSGEVNISPGARIFIDGVQIDALEWNNSH